MSRSGLYSNFDIILVHFLTDFAVTSQKRRMMGPTKCLLDADWCLQSDVRPILRLQDVPRTFPNNTHFLPDGSKYQVRLVLLACSCMLMPASCVPAVCLSHAPRRALF